MTHPSTLRIGAEQCPVAIDFYEADTPYDRSIFETGTAAHAVLQACGEATNKMREVVNFDFYATVAHKVGKRLISEGRTFDGKPEPPLNANRVWAGVELALDYLYQNPLPVGAHYEVGLAVNDQWEPCEYEKGWLQHIADFVQLEELIDEESATVTLISRDYKSAWPTDESELDTLQSKVRALLCLAFHGEEAAQVLSLEVVNLRTLATYRRRYWLQDTETQKMFADWRRQIEATIAAYAKKPRVAAPGVGCYTCPYNLACGAALRAIQDAEATKAAMTAAIGFCAAQGARDHLKGRMEIITGREPIECEFGTVGHQYKEQRALTDDAPGQAWDDWEAAGGDGRGFARALKLGVGNLEAFSKVLLAAEDTKRRKAYVDDLCKTVRKKWFGITKKGGTG